MTKPLENRIYVDHYLQAAILEKLALAEDSLRFSELKEEGIENSLFMYHANKLIARGAVSKTENGFSLTPNGARWVNAVDTNMFAAKPTPRPLVQFVILHGEQLLLSKRKGRLKDYLNEYMLPGGLHKIGMSAEENATRILHTMYPDTTNVPHFITELESIHRYDDGFIYHSLSHVFSLDLTERCLPEDDSRFAFEWVRLHDIQSGNLQFKENAFLQLFLDKLTRGELKNREVIVSEHK